VKLAGQIRLAKREPETNWGDWGGWIRRDGITRLTLLVQGKEGCRDGVGRAFVERLGKKLTRDGRRGRGLAHHPVACSGEGTKKKGYAAIT